MILSHDYTQKQHYLKNIRTGQPVNRGDVLQDFRGDCAAIIGGRAPHKPSSTGRVYTEHGRELFPGVFGCTWEPVA